MARKIDPGIGLQKKSCDTNLIKYTGASYCVHSSEVIVIF